MVTRRSWASVWAAALMLCSAGAAPAADWPTWRHDASRGAATDEQLAAELHLQWVRRFAPVRPTWPDAPRVLFDPVHQPVVTGKTMLLALKQSDKLLALDTDTGAEKWRFFAAGPIRFAPAAWKDRVLVGSDDGRLYCLDAASGKVLWKFRGGPSDRRLIGHDRLISTWPISCGPVVAGGPSTGSGRATVYFSAGLWPFMDVFYHALDAASGKVVWTNDETSFLFRSMSSGHPNATALSGPTPQGYAVVVGDRLLIPCGRGLPVCFDRRTGKLLYYEPTAGGKGAVRSTVVVSAAGDYFFSGKGVFDASTGKQLRLLRAPIGVATDRAVYTRDAAWDHRQARTETYKTWRGTEATRIVVPKMYDLPGRYRVRLKAGRRLYADLPGKLFAIELPAPGGKPRVAWSAPMQETVGEMLAADGKLFVVTEEGGIHCFGARKVEPKTWPLRFVKLERAADQWTRQAADILKTTGVTEGYCLVLGAGGQRLIEELVSQSKLHVIAIYPNQTKVAKLRRSLDAQGLYGTRVSAQVGDPLAFELPPFIAGLIIVEDLKPAGFDSGKRSLEKVFHSLRPYGGALCLPRGGRGRDVLTSWVAEAKPGKAELKRTGAFTLLVRPGPLEGAGTWTHDNADAGRRTFSTDRRVKAPLGVLWFGGEAGGNIYRQGNYPAGPSPLVLGGRMILQGIHSLYAVDVYSGRILWRTPLPPPADTTVATRYVGLRGSRAQYYCYTQALTPDALYLGHGRKCRVFAPATGKESAAWTLPGKDPDARWGNMLVAGDVLVAASCKHVDLRKLPTDQKKLSAREIVRLAEWISALQRIRALPSTTKPVEFFDKHLGKALGPEPLAARFPRYKTHTISPSMENAERIVAVDRKTGTPLWTYDCTYGCQHNSALVAGGGKVFLVDAWPKAAAALLKLRGKLPADYAPKLVALDMKTGSVLWSTTDSVWGVGGLSYSPTRDMLLQAAGRVAKLRVARRARDGTILWKKRMESEGYGFYHPSVIADDVIINYHGHVYDLKTGGRKTIRHPLTGEPVPWALYTRSHGCNHAVASEKLVLLRVGNAAYVDLVNFAGTHSLGGFRSGCQNSLIVADGVLSAPRYSRCACEYPIWTSLGLIHMPELERWSFFGALPVKGRVKRVGINLGAPGDRRAEDGTLWLDYPSVGGPSPVVPVKVAPADVEWFRHRSARFAGDGLRWVAASGGKGIRELTLTLAPDAKEEKSYRVRLHFGEPDDVKPGERRFDVAIQGKNVLRNLDVVRDAGGRNRTLVREFRKVAIRDRLTVRLTPSPGTEVPTPVLSGVEVRME